MNDHDPNIPPDDTSLSSEDTLASEQNLKKTKWKIIPGKWIFGFLLFWIISMVGAGLIARAGGTTGSESGWVILTMLFFVGYAAATDRQKWSTWKKILWFFGCWILQAIISIPAALLVYPFASIRPEYADRAISFWAALPIILWSMHKSTSFMREESQELQQIKDNS